MVAYTCNPTQGRLRQEEHGEFQATLDFTVSSSSAWDSQTVPKIIRPWWYIPIFLALWKGEQEALQIETILVYRMRPCLRKYKMHIHKYRF